MVNWEKILEGKIEDLETLNEVAYAKNVGIHEMFRFMQVATPEQEEEMETIILNADWDSYKELINKVLGTELY